MPAAAAGAARVMADADNHDAMISICVHQCAPLFAGACCSAAECRQAFTSLQAPAVAHSCSCHKTRPRNPITSFPPNKLHPSLSAQWKVTPRAPRQRCLRAHRTTSTCTSFKSRPLITSSSPSGFFGVLGFVFRGLGSCLCCCGLRLSSNHPPATETSDLTGTVTGNTRGQKRAVTMR